MARAWQSFEDPRRLAPSPVRGAPKAVVPGSYCGISLYAKRLVFDTSNSMRGERIAATKRDLIATVASLDEDRYFGLVAFNSGVTVWQSALAPANDQSKRAAEYWIQSQQLAAPTASYDATERALQFDAEAIYFLTDGAPSGGKIDDPTEIVRSIGLLNQARRESIYSIGVGLRSSGNKHEVFLKSLATTNYGFCRRMDQ